MIILANAGVPMLAIEWPLMWLSFVPVVLVETLVAKRILQLSFKQSLAPIAVANLASTIIGIPVSWGAMLALSLATTGGSGGFTLNTWYGVLGTVTLAASWLAPYEQDIGWLIPSALMVLLLPAFFASVWIERFVCRLFWKGADSRSVSRAVWRGNLFSYGLLELLCLGFLIYALGVAPSTPP